jgi:DNA-binding NtrC family response regulator
MKERHLSTVANNPSKDPRKIVLLIAEDNNVHPTLKKNLRREGYSVLLAVEAEDAYEWMGGGYIHADIVVVDLIGKTTDEALSVGREVRQHAKYNGHTPLIVMAEKYGKDVEGTVVNVEGNDWIHYLGEDPDQLQNLLSRLIKGADENEQEQKIA